MFPSFPHFYKLSRNLSFPLVSKTFPMGSLTDFWKPLEIDIFSLTDFYSNQGTHWKCFGNQRKPQNNRFLLNLNFEPQGKELGLREKAAGGGDEKRGCICKAPHWLKTSQYSSLIGPTDFSHFQT